MVDTLDQLAEIPALVAEVIATAYAPNPSSRAERTGKTGGRTPPVPANLTVLDLLRPGQPGHLHNGTDDDCQDQDSHLMWLLQEAARAVTEEADTAGWDTPNPPDPEWSALCSWLTQTASFWQGNRLTREWVTSNTAQVHKTLCRAARIPKPVTYRCRHVGLNGDSCGAILHEEQGGALMRCETGHEVSHWAAIRREIELQELPLPEVLRVLQRHWQMQTPNYEAAKKWVQRGQLVPSGRAKGKQLFRVGYVHEIIAKRILAQ